MFAYHVFCDFTAVNSELISASNTRHAKHTFTAPVNASTAANAAHWHVLKHSPTCLNLGCRSTMKWLSGVVVNMQAAAFVISWLATGKNLAIGTRILCINM